MSFLIIQYQFHIDMITIFDALMQENLDAAKIVAALQKMHVWEKVECVVSFKPQ